MDSRGRDLPKEVLANESGQPVIVALDEPVVVVVIAEALEGLVQAFEVGVCVDPEKLLFERSPESLNAAVAFGSVDEGGAGVHAEEAQLGLEGSGDKLGAIVMPQIQAFGDGLVDASEGRAAGLVERHHGLVAIRVQGGVDAMSSQVQWS